jgi:transcription initiation factor TFIIIB Brf1 subunit/transcription initiation factor TFIIB
MRCPWCGANPVIYDAELNALVCTHCGAVIDDRPVPYTVPVVDEPFYGTVLKSARHGTLIYRHFDSVYGPGGSLARRASGVVKSQCKALGVSGSICVEVKRRVLEAVERITKEQDVRLVRSKMLEYISAACMYAVLLERGYPVRLSDLSSRLGLEAGELYSFLVKYGSVVGYKYTNKVKAYAPRVAEALFKQLGGEDVARVMERAVELMDKYSYLSTDPLKSAIAFVALAARELGVEVSVATLCRELGLRDGEADSMYARIKRIAKRIRGLKNA